MPTNNAELKKKFRMEVKSRFQQITVDEFQSANEQIKTVFFELEVVKKAQRIMLYYSIENEVETITIIKKLIDDNKQIYLPACIDNLELESRRVVALNLLVEGKMKIKEPDNNAQVIDPKDLDLIVVPGIAFDGNKNRLGHGAGYYDRFLTIAQNVYKLGLCYQFQMFTSIPTDKHDIVMDAVLTPLKLI